MHINGHAKLLKIFENRKSNIENRNENVLLCIFFIKKFARACVCEIFFVILQAECGVRPTNYGCNTDQ